MRKQFSIVLAFAALTVGGAGCAPSQPDSESTSAVAGPAPPPSGALPATNAPPPFHTDGRWIVDSNGERVKLAGLNWVGFEGPHSVAQALDLADLDTIVETIRYMGFNTVRLPWSNQMWEQDPPINPKLLARNPSLQGLKAKEVFGAVVAALTAKQIYVVLDNHINEAADCCGADNTLWWDGFTWLPDHDDFDKMNAQWESDWLEVVKEYGDNPYVIGVDLHNEPRGAACWGCGEKKHDWPRAAQALGNKIVAKNDNLLIIVEGLQLKHTRLEGVRDLPIQLKASNRLVYSTHDYGNGHYNRHTADGICDDPAPEVRPNNPKSHEEFFKMMKAEFGFILDGGKPYTAPVWIGEFGRENVFPNPTCKYQDVWWTYFTEYLHHRDMDWSYFGATGKYYGVIDALLPPVAEPGSPDTMVLQPYSTELLDALQGLEAAKRGPKVSGAPAADDSDDSD